AVTVSSRRDGMDTIPGGTGPAGTEDSMAGTRTYQVEGISIGRGGDEKTMLGRPTRLHEDAMIALGIDEEPGTRGRAAFQVQSSPGGPPNGEDAGPRPIARGVDTRGIGTGTCQQSQGSIPGTGAAAEDTETLTNGYREHHPVAGRATARDIHAVTSRA